MKLKENIKEVLLKDVSDTEKINIIKDIVKIKKTDNMFKDFWELYLWIKKANWDKKKIKRDFDNEQNQKDIIIWLKNYIKQYNWDMKYFIQPNRFIRDKIYKLYIIDEKKIEKYFICNYWKKHLIWKRCDCLF